MTDFATLGLAEPLLRALATEGYTSPTPIQQQAIPPILAGEDVLGIAQTGTGKTAAFVLPLLHRLNIGRTRPAPRCCSVLVLAPTRELAAQIHEAVKTYGRHLRPSAAVVVGGVKPGAQLRAMAPGVEILVATPGRLLDHMSTGAIRLDQTRFVVLDEVDQMLDLGFLPAIKKIIAKLPQARQAIALSATMPPPIRALADELLRRPREIAVAAVSRPIERIEQKVFHVAAAEKRARMVDLLRELKPARAILFTRTKHGADRLTSHLVAHRIEAAAIHGNKSQSQRERALAAFKDGTVGVLVATDIAARGIDVDGVSHVFNVDLPNVPEAYVHRIGRTARAGADGIAISLCDPTERAYLRDIERLIGFRIEGIGTPPPQTPAERVPEPVRAAPEQDRARGNGRGNTRGNGRGSGHGTGQRANPARPAELRHGDGRPSEGRRGEGRPGDHRSAEGRHRDARRGDGPAHAQGFGRDSGDPRPAFMDRSARGSAHAHGNPGPGQRARPAGQQRRGGR